jgi:hypothetical protein
MGSRLEIKVEKIKNPTIFWQPSRTYCLNMTKSEIFFTWNLVGLAHSWQKSFFLVWVRIILLGCQVAKIQPKENADTQKLCTIVSHTKLLVKKASFHILQEPCIKCSGHCYNFHFTQSYLIHALWIWRFYKWKWYKIFNMVVQA